MPEEEHLDGYLTKIRHLYHLKISEHEKEKKELERLLAEKDEFIRAQKAQIQELREMTLYAATFDIFTHPTFVVGPENTIRLATEKALALLHHEESDVHHRSLGTYTRGLEFLDQIQQNPSLRAVENLESLTDIPFALKQKEGSEVLVSATVRFLSPLHAYHGVIITFEPKKEKSLLQKTREHLPRYLGGTNKYPEVDASEYSQDRRIIILDQAPEKDSVLNGNTLLKKITKEVLQIDDLASDFSNRSVVVNLLGVIDCDPHFYEGLKTISEMPGRPLRCIVHEGSVVYEGLIKAGFAEDKIVKERKHKLPKGNKKEKKEET